MSTCKLKSENKNLHIMKRFRLSILVFTIAVNAMMITTCKEKEKDYLSVTPTRLYFSGRATEGQNVRVDTNVKEYTVTIPCDWIDVKEANDGGFTVFVTSYNNSSVERSETISVKGGKAEAVITVIQDPASNIILSIEPSTVTFVAGELATKDVVVTTNENWTFQSPPEWLKIERDGATLKVTPANLNFTDNALVAAIAITAGDVTETLTVTQAISETPEITGEPVTFARANILYWGDIDAIGIGTANYDIILENQPDGYPYVWIESFSTQQSGGEDLKLDAGTYIFDNKSGSAKTFAGGIYEDGWNEVEIIGGTLTVSFSEGNYTIHADFEGKDQKGKQYSGLRYDFTGTLFFVNCSEYPEVEFTDITSGDYSAKGKISGLFIDDPGPETWTGSFEAGENQHEKFYEFLNFSDLTFNFDFVHYCIYEDGFIYIDGAYPLAGNEEYELFLRALWQYEDEEGIYVLGEAYKHPVRYFKDTGILDFSDYFFLQDGTRVTVYVAIVAIPKSGDMSKVEWFSDFYENLKYQLPVSAVSPTRKTGKTIHKNKHNMTGFQSRYSATARSMPVMSGKSGMTKISKEQLKKMDTRSFQSALGKKK